MSPLVRKRTSKNPAPAAPPSWKNVEASVPIACRAPRLLLCLGFSEECGPRWPAALPGASVRRWGGDDRPRSGSRHGEGMDARVEATQERLPDARQAPSGLSFSLEYFSFTPGILPSALRASFAVRMRACANVDKQKRSTSRAVGARKLLLLGDSVQTNSKSGGQCPPYETPMSLRQINPVNRRPISVVLHQPDVRQPGSLGNIKLAGPPGEYHRAARLHRRKDP